MRKASGVVFAVVAALSVALFCVPLQAQELGDGVAESGKFGAGIILGAPSGVTGKYYFTDAQAIDFHLGGIPFFRESYFGSVALGAAYLLELFELADAPEFRMVVYGGAGGMLLFNAGETRIYDNDLEGFVPAYDFGAAARFPGGLSAQLKHAPVEIFAEISPSLALLIYNEAPVDLSVHLFHGALGARYYFN